MKKNAQGLSMTTIVVAALALIVLVVIAIIFTGRMGNFASGIKETSTCARACIAAGYSNGGTSSQTSCAESVEKELIGFEETKGETCCCKISTT